ncbi:MAG: hypothetical protein A2902_04310 [Elusimicrobia bacterium RIFCSPLOWO2_01_FULL_64_13]|nr:MAG: hypothetical protein A2636_02030 [Elusimicrobia bacterium RIFCSPHIGHO2_01_FULL_64_10]OGR95025.1 MAG: hypothetical protein A2902_04310 [Elusimicrobia bacterium RIFCSPLOWO2_01_FULL_64_13]
MGGDFGPEKIISGAIDFARETRIGVVLVGKEDAVRAELDKHAAGDLPVTVHPASEVIDMHESPSKASRSKQDASIVVAMRLVAQGAVDAVVSAGNSGAVMTSALRYLGRIHGVYRPAIATVLPTQSGHCMIADVGANADCKPEYLLQFGVMAKVAAQTILGIPDPGVGLLSIGEEKGKGNHLTKRAHQLFADSTEFRFIGNVEGRDIPRGKADVVVCDGFVGNAILKTMEGTAEVMGRMIKMEIKSSLPAFLGYLFMRPALKRFRKRVDYAEYGGAPLLGVNGICIICHGKSTPKAIKNALKVAELCVEKRVNEEIAREIRIVSPHGGPASPSSFPNPAPAPAAGRARR